MDIEGMTLEAIKEEIGGLYLELKMLHKHIAKLEARLAGPDADIQATHNGAGDSTAIPMEAARDG